MTVFDGIEMDVIHVASMILLVSDQVFPIAALPKAPFPFPLAAP